MSVLTAKKYEWHQHSEHVYQCVDSNGTEVAAVYQDLSDPDCPGQRWTAVLCTHPYGQILISQIFSNPKHAAETTERILNGSGDNLHISMKSNP
jgi:hypothetical protein